MKKFICLFIWATILLPVACFSQTIKGTYAIKNVQTGMLLRIKDANKKDGTPVVAYSPVNWKCMTWDFQHIGGQTYQLKNLFTGKTLEPQAEKASEGVNLEQQPLVMNAPVQQYEFILLEKDTYLIRLKGTELYLTPSDNNGSTNSAIILTRKTDTKAQQWTIYEQHPDM